MGQASWPAWDIPIPKDTISIKAWANQSTIYRGYLDIRDKSLGKTAVGSATSVLGEAQANGVLSLGDSGYVDLAFNGVLFDGPGIDFAVFENAFDNYFLELAFVEVSSDGQQFFRFPAHSLTDTLQQVGSFDSLDARLLHNLAGKYASGFGVGFDLSDMANTPGLDIQHITHLRVVDVVGSLNSAYASYDVNGNKVNDPFPTPFPSGGFDLDAAAAIHIRPLGIEEYRSERLEFYPNPTANEINISPEYIGGELQVLNASGQLQKQTTVLSRNYSVYDLQPGVYFLQIRKANRFYTAKLIKR